MDKEPEFSRDLIDYHYGVRYEEKQPDAERERLLSNKIKKWRESPD